MKVVGLNEITESRFAIEKRYLEWFDSFSLFLSQIVDEILSMYKEGKISQHEAIDLLYYQLMETYASHDEVINKQLQLYLEEMYQLGLHSIGIREGFDGSDILLLYLLFKVLKDYILKAERKYLSKVVQQVERKPKDVMVADSPYKRFEVVIVSEGTRTFNAGIILKAINKNWMLKFTTEGDEKVCLDCMALDGKIYHPDEAWFILPRHSYCRCFFVVVTYEDIIGESEKY